MMPAAAIMPAVAQDATSTVTVAGVVRDTRGRVLSGAEVRSGERLILTSDSGTFVLSELRSVSDTSRSSLRSRFAPDWRVATV